MKYRDVVIFNGMEFQVPRNIQRIDTRDTHGWQVRYGGTKLFSDHSNDGSGAQRALERATRELARRIAHLPPQLPLGTERRARKNSELPVGISGPIVRRNPDGSVMSYSFSVLLPRFGQRARGASVYIGANSTFTTERYRIALAKAVAMRHEAVVAYEREARVVCREVAKALSASVARAARRRSASEPDRRSDD